jgi:hypothetical protein
MDYNESENCTWGGQSDPYDYGPESQYGQESQFIKQGMYGVPLRAPPNNAPDVGDYSQTAYYYALTLTGELKAGSYRGLRGKSSRQFVPNIDVPGAYWCGTLGAGEGGPSPPVVIWDPGNMVGEMGPGYGDHSTNSDNCCNADNTWSGNCFYLEHGIDFNIYIFEINDIPNTTTMSSFPYASPDANREPYNSYNLTTPRMQNPYMLGTPSNLYNFSQWSWYWWTADVQWTTSYPTGDPTIHQYDLVTLEIDIGGYGNTYYRQAIPFSTTSPQTYHIHPYDNGWLQGLYSQYYAGCGTRSYYIKTYWSNAWTYDVSGTRSGTLYNCCGSNC